VICYYISDSEYYFFKGSVKGNISTNVSRIAGFGYDPIFIPQGYNQSFSQLDVAIKNQISHRAVAFQKLKKML
jgi:XTP/dITP diphosphohydrolase